MNRNGEPVVTQLVPIIWRVKKKKNKKKPQKKTTLYTLTIFIWYRVWSLKLPRSKAHLIFYYHFFFLLLFYYYYIIILFLMYYYITLVLILYIICFCLFLLFFFWTSVLKNKHLHVIHTIIINNKFTFVKSINFHPNIISIGLYLLICLSYYIYFIIILFLLPKNVMFTLLNNGQIIIYSDTHIFIKIKTNHSFLYTIISF